MALRHPIDDISLQHGASGVVILHPSLRAAYRLEQRHGGFTRLAGLIAGGAIGVIKDVIQEAALDDPADLLTEIDYEPIGRTLDRVTGPLLTFVIALTGLDLDDNTAPATPSPIAKPFDWRAHHEHLFELGTGWLGWSAEATWNATPAEITAAFNGRNTMFKTLLSAVFGEAEEEPTAEPKPYVEPVLTAEGLDPEFDRAGLLALGAKMKA